MFRINAVFCRSVSGRGKPSQTANAHDDLGFYLPLYAIKAHQSCCGSLTGTLIVILILETGVVFSS